VVTWRRIREGMVCTRPHRNSGILSLEEKDEKSRLSWWVCDKGLAIRNTKLYHFSPDFTVPFFLVVGSPFTSCDKKMMVSRCPLARCDQSLPVRMQGTTESITPYLGLVFGDEFEP
jgi:hypothetical protein